MSGDKIPSLSATHFYFGVKPADTHCCSSLCLLSFFLTVQWECEEKLLIFYSKEWKSYLKLAMNPDCEKDMRKFFFLVSFPNFFFFTSSKLLKISLHVLLAVHWLNVNLLGIAEVKFCSCNRWLNVFFFLFLWMLNCTIVVNFFVLRGFVITYKCSDI